MKIAIIGCGYVGLTLAKALSSQGHFVTATIRTPQRIQHIDPFCQKVLCLKGSDKDGLEKIVQENDLLIITLAAKNLEEYESAYLETAENIKNIALYNEKKSLIYTSSTSVYGDHGGEWVDEEATLLAKSPNAKILIETEKAYLALQESGWNVTIFRLSEIYGPGRDLKQKAHAVEGKIFPGDGNHFSNMIHLKDIEGAVLYAISHNLKGIYNLSDDEHPRKNLWYHELAKCYSFNGAVFDPSIKKTRSTNKKVSNHKIKSAGYSFTYPEREW